MALGPKLFSGEPLPVAPKTDDPEIDAFFRKLLDYLRRLAGLLNQFVGPPPPPGAGGETPSIACYFTADQDSDNVFNHISWTQDVWKDGPFDHDTVGTPWEVLVLEDGFYLISLVLRTLKGAFTTNQIRVSISDSGGAGVVFHPFFGESTLGPAGGGGQSGTMTLTVALPLIANKAITIYYRQDLGFTPSDIIAVGSSLTISKLRSEATTGGDNPTDPGFGWDSNPPSWGVTWTP